MITAENIITEYPKLNQTVLPETLKKSEFDFIKENIDLYGQDKDIDEYINAFVSKLNKYAGSKKETPKAKATGKPKQKSKPKKQGTTTKVVAEPKPKAKEKTSSKPKAKKRIKSTREKKAEVPFWLQTIRGFLRLANKERTQTSLRKFLYDLQAKFDATRNKCVPTPHISLIKKIQAIVIEQINKDIKKRKLTIKVNQAFIDELQNVTKTVVVSTKLEKPKVKRMSLSGIKKKSTDKPQHLSGLGIVPTTELQKMKFKTLPFTGNWKKLIGNPSVPFHFMFYGTGGSGKSTISIQLAHYLAEHFDFKVLYVAKEEGISQTAQEKFKRFNAYHRNIFISDGSNLNRLRMFDVAILDSVNELNLQPDDIRRIQAQNPKLSTIQIFKATKEGKFLGQNDFMHIVQAQFRCEDGFCYPEKNRFGGNETIKINFK